MGLNGTDNVGSGASDEEVASEASTPTEVEAEIVDEVGQPSAQNQTIYDLLANADVDAATAASDSLLDRLRALHDAPGRVERDWYPGLLAAANATVQHYGYGHAAGDHTITGASGGGTVSFGQFGAQVSPGATSGDTAYLASGGHDYQEGKGVVIGEVYIELMGSSTSPLGDTAKVGFDTPGDYSTGANLAGHAGVLDLGNGEYNAGGSTQAFDTAVDADTMFHIVGDLNGGDIHFYRNGTLKATLTPSSSPIAGSMCVNMQSNGSGNEIRFVKSSVTRVI